MLDFSLRYGLLPEFALNLASQYLIKQRLTMEKQSFQQSQGQNKLDLIAGLKSSKIALSTDKANEQHYEVPTKYFQLVLGPHLKYSSCYWESDTETLSSAEENMLKIYCRRAELKPGQRILDLGCGWGSASLYIAEHIPDVEIYCISNSATQKQHIEQQAKQRGLNNIHCIKADTNHVSFDQQFDRIISIELFEHLRNYEIVLKNVSQWLAPEGRLFVHIFCHKQYAYPFSVDEKNSWMAQHFFTDGIMPSADLLSHFQQDLKLANQWEVNGTHYAKTCDAWLQRHKAKKREILEIFAQCYGAQDATLYWEYWRIFYMASRNLFAWDEGNEWFVSHYLFEHAK